MNSINVIELIKDQSRKVKKLDLKLFISNIFLLFGFFLILIGYFSLQNRIFFKINFLPLIFSTVIYLVFVYFLTKSTQSLKVEEQKTNAILRGVLSFLVVAIAFAPVSIAAIKMSIGNYPEVFFTVDTPYHFSQVLELSRTMEYPPKSLNNLDVVFNYHFGTQLAAAELTKLGISANKSYFGVLFFGFLISIAASIYAMLKLVGRSGYLLALTIPLSSFSFYWGIFTDRIFPTQAFSGGFPHLSYLSMIYLVHLLIYFYLLNPNSIIFKTLLALLPGYSLLFKSSSFFLFGFFSAGYVIYLILSKGFKKIDFGFILLGSITLLSVWFSTTNGDSEFHSIGLFKRAQPEEILRFLIFYGMVFGLIIFKGRKKIFVEIIPFIFSLLGILILYSTFRVRVAGYNTRDIQQITYQAPQLLAGGILVALTKLRTEVKLSIINFAITPILLLAVFFGMNRIYNLNLVLSKPESWYEYVNNKNLAECLINVPVPDSILVTNDLHYPADNFTRDLSQWQIPAIFGHQMYAGDFNFEKGYVDQSGIIAQKILISGTKEEITSAAKKHNWTYAVIFKRSTYANIFESKVCENNELFIAKLN